jgi:penicillin-binding protein 2
MTEGKTGLRVRIVSTFVAFLFAALGARLWFVQVLNTQQYRHAVLNNSIRVVPIPAPRGRILDRDGHLLVGNRFSLAVTVNRDMVGSQDEEVLYRLARLLKLPVKDLTERLNDPRFLPYVPVPVAFDVSKQVAFYIGEHQEEFPGVDTVELSTRTYPHGDLAAHLLGYTGQISAEQLKERRFAGYSQNAIVGRAGVESTYERRLQGIRGALKVQVNSQGKNLGTIGREPARPGDDLVLSINERIQQLAEQSLSLGMKSAHGAGLPAVAGAVVVMNPRNGQVLALGSNPTFDPKFFERPFTEKQYRQAFLLPKQHNPQFDRAIQAGYPAGSTFKPFVALAALHNHIASRTGFYPCPPTFTVPGTENNPVPEVKNNWSSTNFGSISLSESLVISCDTVFYQFGWDFWRRYVAANGGAIQKAPGVGEAFQRDLRTFDFGRRTGVDLPAEEPGVIPNQRWKHQNFSYIKKRSFCIHNWCPGDDLNMSIGQGDVRVTPLQLATAFSAIANGGTVWQPHVALRVQRANGRVVSRIEPKATGRLPFSRGALAFIRQALSGVVSRPEGTAYSAFVGFPFNAVSVAGKTGTAEVPPFQPYSWFGAMAPVQHPRFVVVALVEQGGHGSDTAAPIVRRILEGLFGKKLSGTIHTATQKD